MDQKHACFALQQEVVRYPAEYPFAQAGMSVGSGYDDISSGLGRDCIQVAAGVTGGEFDPCRRRYIVALKPFGHVGDMSACSVALALVGHDLDDRQFSGLL